MLLNPTYWNIYLLVPDSVDMHTVHQLRIVMEGCKQAFQFVGILIETLTDEALANWTISDITWDVFIAVHDLLSGDYK